MPSYKNVLTFAAIAFIIIITVHLLFNKQSLQSLPNKTESFDPNIVCPNNQNELDNESYLLESLLRNTQQCPYKQIKNKFVQPIQYKQNIQSEQFTQSEQNIQSENCSNKPQTTKEFQNDFFKFRDSTFGNSSMHLDSVDKVTDLYLSGNLSQARNYPNVKIQDLFDHTTHDINLYERQCVRLPYFDNINPDGYYQNYGTPGTHIVRDEWNYNQNNVTQGIHPNDNDFNYNQDLSVYNK